MISFIVFLDMACSFVIYLSLGLCNYAIKFFPFYIMNMLGT